jgi:hypothetical protein
MSRYGNFQQNGVFLNKSGDKLNRGGQGAA